jgi:nucleotide-binding universal stress UspA family protein
MSSAERLFEHVLCGVDGTPASTAAVEQALRLQDGRLTLVAAANLAQAAQAGMAARHAAGELQDEAEEALAAAGAIAPGAARKVVNGDPVAVLLREAEDATVAVVGSHGHGRARGMLLGTVAARLVHDAPCSVLVARPAADPDRWPQSVVVGVDGSEQSAAAFAAARLIAERFDGTMRAVVATKDASAAEPARTIAADLEEEVGRAKDVLVRASESADLVVVGSRGLRALKALGSVSERVAHGASCSVLVVRSQSP